MAQPPHYVLYSHSPLSAAPSTSLGHPVIQYHYADDSPLALLPQTPDEHVLILEFDPSFPSTPTAKSISKNIAVTGLKIAEAPGAAAEENPKNSTMYILETTTIVDDKLADTPPGDHSQATLALFQQRNAVLRRALSYPDTPKETEH